MATTTKAFLHLNIYKQPAAVRLFLFMNFSDLLLISKPLLNALLIMNMFLLETT